MNVRRTKHTLSKGAAAKQINAVRDSDIDYSDIPPLDEEFFRTARLLMPQRKTPVALRLDEDVLQFFKKKGEGYQSRINAVLRAYMATQQQRRTAKENKR